jgi:hypothetical protein
VPQRPQAQWALGTLPRSYLRLRLPARRTIRPRPSRLPLRASPTHIRPCTIRRRQNAPRAPSGSVPVRPRSAGRRSVQDRRISGSSPFGGGIAGTRIRKAASGRVLLRIGYKPLEIPFRWQIRATRPSAALLYSRVHPCGVLRPYCIQLPEKHAAQPARWRPSLFRLSINARKNLLSAPMNVFARAKSA